MDIEWVSLRRLFIEESRYGRTFNTDNYKMMCEKYGFAEAVGGWAKTEDVKQVPNLSANIVREGAPDIREFFSRYHSFKTKDGEIYWTVSPNSNGWSMEQLVNAFRVNAITCDIMPGFAGDFAIVMKPRQLVEECNNYVVGRSQEKMNKYAMYLINIPLSINREVVVFDTENEAKAFRAGMDYAIEVFVK